MDEFISDLQGLISKHKISFKEHAVYIRDEYQGSDYYLTFDGEPDYTLTVEELLIQLRDNITE